MRAFLFISIGRLGVLVKRGTTSCRRANGLSSGRHTRDNGTVASMAIMAVESASPPQEKATHHQCYVTSGIGARL